MINFYLSMKYKIFLLTLDITLKGGIERVVSNLAESLSNDYEITIISFFKTNKSVAYKIKDGVNVHYINDNLPFNLFNYKCNVFKSFLNTLFFWKYRNSKVISFYPFVSILLIAISFFRNKNIIAAEHSEYFSQGRIIRLLRRLLYSRLEKIVVLTEHGKRCFSEIGLDVSVIPNSVTEFGNPNQFVRFKNFENKLNCLFVGRFEPVKQIGDIINVAKKVESNKSITFDFCGDGYLLESFKQQTKNAGLWNCNFHGSVSDMSFIYSNSHVLLITSQTESFSMVAIEAMSFGVIVISYENLIGPGELIINGFNGYIVNKNDTTEIAVIINKLFSDPALLDDLRSNAIEFSKKFKSQAQVDQWRNLL